MGAVVYASAGGRKYHFNKECPAFHSARELSNWDCCCGDYCTHRSSVTHALKRMSSTKAAMDGKLPCLACVPSHLREMPEPEVFGHEPAVRIDALDGPQPDKPRVCARCIRYARTWSSWIVDYDERAGVQWENGWIHLQHRVAWPCTSAIILGLAPRPCSHCKGNGGDPDDPGDWIPEAGMHNPNTAGPCPACHGHGHQAVGER